MANILNCSPNGGNVITDETATILFFGKKGTIADIYRSSRRTADGKIADTDNLDHIEIQGMKFSKSYLKMFYETLWLQYFIENSASKTEEKIRSYDGYYDGLKETTVNSAARVFWILKKYGMNGLKQNVKPLMSQIKERTRGVKETSGFQYLDNLAKRIIRENYGKYPREELSRLASFEDETSAKTFGRLLSIRYDEYEKNGTAAYIQNELMRIRDAYMKAANSETDTSGVKLE